jgi:DNA adenine methylase
MVKTRPEMVIRHLARLAASHITDPEFYYKVREGWNSDRTVNGKKATVALRAATFIYLNRTCFNGLWRVNNAGEFNVPKGKYEHPLICDPEAIRAASLCLGHASTVCDGYSAMHDAGSGDLVYLDPPYDPVSKTSDFTGYTSGRFGAADQMKVASAVRLMVERGAKVIASNSDTWFIRDLYKGFRIDRVQRPGTMNSVATKRGAVKEVLIMAGYDPPRRKRARARG